MRPRIQYLQRLEGFAATQLTNTLSRRSRFVHSSAQRNVSLQSTPSTSSQMLPASSQPKPPPSSEATLARLPTATVLRSYLIGQISTSPALLNMCFALLHRMLVTKSYLLSAERNPLLAKILKSTFYVQYCIGENKQEVKKNTVPIRTELGYDGIMLEYALEMLGEAGIPTAEETAREIEIWRKGMLDTVEMANEGDFVGLKWSGLGRHAFTLLQAQADPTPEMWSAITEACDAAAAKNVALLPGAEEEITNIGLEKWSRMLQKKYNTPEAGRAIMYTTYQCYLKGIPDRIAQDLETASKEGYIAGVKLVRGAYMRSEPKDLIFETKEGTDDCYDACAEAVLKREWTPRVKPSNPATPFPETNIVLATHNLTSITKAQKIREAQLLTSPPESLPRLSYIQLLGMADEISQALVQNPGMKADVQAKAIKCMTWGTTTQCLNFLLRRASENKEAALRVDDTRRAMGREIWRRMKGVFGMA